MSLWKNLKYRWDGGPVADMLRSELSIAIIKGRDVGDTMLLLEQIVTASRLEMIAGGVFFLFPIFVLFVVFIAFGV